MERWKLFEENACKYLNNLAIKDILFEIDGSKSNSWESDIKVKKFDKTLFLIEAKLSPSQSGQFVILPENGKYVYSSANQHKENCFSREIIDWINSNADKFLNCGTKGVPVNVDKKILAGWIKNHYKEKHVKFIIVSEHAGDFQNNFIKIMKLDNFEKNFDISAILRCKKSGSTRMPKKYFEEVISILNDKFGEGKFKLYLNGEVEIDNYNKKKEYLPNRFYISKNDKKFYIKRLSATNNPSLIFSLKYIGPKKTGGIDELIKAI